MALIPPAPVGGQFGSYTWQDWYEKVRTAINESSSIAWSQITNFTGSTLSAIETRPHNVLQSMQGGNGTDEFYHLTAAEDTALAAGYSGSVALAKVTPGGTDGSLTVSHGVITAYTAPT
jgi:hypothetical protein